MKNTSCDVIKTAYYIAKLLHILKLMHQIHSRMCKALNMKLSYMTMTMTMTSLRPKGNLRIVPSAFSSRIIMAA